MASDWKPENVKINQNTITDKYAKYFSRTVSKGMMVEQEAQRMKEIGGIGDMEMLIRLKERKGKERKGTLSGQENVLLSLSAP